MRTRPVSSRTLERDVLVIEVEFRSGRIAGLLALAAAELKLVNDDAQLMALLIVLGPLRVAQLAVDGDLGALEEVLGQLLGAGAEQGALDEHGGIDVLALGVLALLIDRDGEPCDCEAAGGGAHLHVARQVALDDDSVDCHV